MMLNCLLNDGGEVLACLNIHLFGLWRYDELSQLLVDDLLHKIASLSASTACFHKRSHSLLVSELQISKHCTSVSIFVMDNNCLDG